MDRIATKQYTPLTYEVKTTKIPKAARPIKSNVFIDLCSDEKKIFENHSVINRNTDDERYYTISDSDEDDDDVIVIDDIKSMQPSKTVKKHAHRMIPHSNYSTANFNNSSHAILEIVEQHPRLNSVTIALRPMSNGNVRQQKRSNANKSTISISSGMKENVRNVNKSISHLDIISLDDDNPTMNSNEIRFEGAVELRNKLFSVLQEYELQIKDAWDRQNKKVNKRQIATGNNSTNSTSSTNETERIINSTDTTDDIQPQAKRMRSSNGDKLIVADNISTATTANSSDFENDTTEQTEQTLQQSFGEDFNLSNQSMGSINPSEDVIKNILIKTRSEFIEEPRFAKRVLVNYNNDCQMTAMDTQTCALCHSKPKDLTNHYVRRHKTESYISRLPWFQLSNLINNTNYVQLIECVYGNESHNRYIVTCPFCNDVVEERFHNFYEHFSMHTGEYAYGCETCNFTKPFASDIKQHQKQSKLCQMSNVKILYRYPAESKVILLHYCYICNFVQLNEANVAKHLRDHHTDNENLPTNIRNCILASIT